LIRSGCLASREQVINWQVELCLRRRSFERYADDLHRLGKARGQMTCMALIDVDQIKQINDRFSHHVGDAELKRIAQVLKAHVWEFDWSALSPGRQSGISVGVARAEQQDTVEALTHRSDTAMYLKKPRPALSPTLH
jgi:hypothetical protein